MPDWNYCNGSQGCNGIRMKIWGFHTFFVK